MGGVCIMKPVSEFTISASVICLSSMLEVSCILFSQM